jgi:acetate kinase
MAADEGGAAGLARGAEATVLVVNCGSSSVRYRLLAMDAGRSVAGGMLERIGETDPRLHRRDAEGRERSEPAPARDHREAFGHIAAALRREGALDPERLAAIGHRVVHGGERFRASALIDPGVREAIRELASLAPLHNPANLVGIDACLDAFPGVPQVAVFDTAFHQTMPPFAFRYAVPDAWYRGLGVRRYGFHGTSHRYVAERAARALGRPLTELSLVTLHLGNGASAAAIREGRSVDTSMGMTPLEGLVMGTRSGDLDPAVPLYVQRAAGLDAGAVDDALNHRAGLEGLAGASDVRELLARESAGDERARLALEVYAYRVKKYIGAYFAALGRLDALVFTGGVGENASRVRSLACAGLERLGIALDERANAAAAGELSEIGRAGTPVRVLVVRTDEELQIAREALAVVRGG